MMSEDQIENDMASVIDCMFTPNATVASVFARLGFSADYIRFLMLRADEQGLVERLAATGASASAEG